MTAVHQLDLTGGFRLIGAHGGEIRLSGRKGRALLAIVALSPGLSVSRARLRSLLWAERGEQQAADSLRQQLAVLRKELGPAADAILIMHDDQIGLVDRAIDIDVKAIGDAMEARGWLVMRLIRPTPQLQLLVDRLTDDLQVC